MVRNLGMEATLMNTSRTPKFRAQPVTEDPTREIWVERACKRLTRFNEIALWALGVAFAWYIVEVIKELMK